jgi:Anthranilate/para-aminobenzoate synthases component I
LNNVKIAKKYIKLGDIFQVVLSQRFEAKLQKNPIDIYKKSEKQTLLLFYILLIIMTFKLLEVVLKY